MIYVAHPYGGSEANKEHVEKHLKMLFLLNPEETFVSPIHSFGFLYEVVDYETGLEYCFDLLATCDEMLVFGDYKNSRGCLAEIVYCEDHNKPYRIIEEATK